MSSRIGEHLERREDRRFLSGRGQFVDDVHVEGLLHAAIYRSSRAHGVVRSVDVSAARAHPGVVAVLTRDDIDMALKPIRPRIAAMPNFQHFLRLPIATDKVRYVGEPIAVVVAESRYVAEDALASISVDIENLPPILTWEMASRGDTLIHQKAGTNTSTVEVGRGDAEAVFQSAFYTRRARFTVQRHAAVPMETRGLVAVWDNKDARMTVSGITKVPFFNRTLLSEMLGLPEKSVVMKVADAGGGFGVRGEFYPEDFLVPYLARRLDRPVKWIEDRWEHFLATNHSRQAECDLEIACDRDGTIVGLRGEVAIDIGAYARGTGGTAPTRCAQFLPGPYRIPNFACKVSAYLSNKTPAGTYRGPGRFEAHFFRERLIDMAAADLGIDPADIRRRNFVTSGEMPFNTGQLVTYEGPAQLNSGDYPAVFEQALTDIGWAEKRAMQGRAIDGWYHGIGFASFAESSAGGVQERARIRLGRDGTLDVFVGSTSSGQGHETVFAQVAADALHVPIESFKSCARPPTNSRKGSEPGTAARPSCLATPSAPRPATSLSAYAPSPPPISASPTLESTGAKGNFIAATPT